MYKVVKKPHQMSVNDCVSSHSDSRDWIYWRRKENWRKEEWMTTIVGLRRHRPPRCSTKS